MKFHIRDLEAQIRQREAGVSPLANTPKPERDDEVLLVNAPRAGEQKD
ncbi:unnamed protein product [Enterobius vermicularis]|uniref:Anaphase-promoting complex subunit CDC26 n=1 Tax=Enterobius vermicularis TaxID=51028 RepID=A0A0N4VN98_ENTVE|nr:unnamed protein product [Enterobius vermicularis]